MFHLLFLVLGILFCFRLEYFLFLVVEYAIDLVGQITAKLLLTSIVDSPVIEFLHQKLAYHGRIEPA